MEVIEQDDGSLAVISNIPDADGVTLQHAWDVVGQAGNLPLDIAQSVMTSYSTVTSRAKCSGRNRQVGGYIQCPKCGTPWIANLCQASLLGCPRTAHTIKKILKKERKQPKKLTSLEKIHLSSYCMRENVIQLSCFVCKHKMRQCFPVPVKEKPTIESKPSTVKRKKKKKCVKEINAGLRLSTINPSTTKDLKPTSSSRKHISEEKKAPGFSQNTKKTANDNVTEGFLKKRKGNKKFNLTDHSMGSILPSSASASLPKDFKSSLKLVSEQTISTHKEKKEKKKKLSGLKTAMLKDMSDHKESSKNNTLGDFLQSLI